MLFFILNSVKSYAQENDSLTISLKEAVQKGLKNNFGIRISKKDTEKANNNDTWGKAGIFPIISLNANQINHINNTAGSGENAYINSLSPNLNIKLNLFNGFSAILSKQNSEYLKLLSEGNLKLTLENTVAEIVNAYNLVLLEEEKLKVTENLMKLSKDRYKYILIKKDLGLSVRYQVLQEKNSFLTDSLNFLSQLMNKQNAMRELGKVLGDTEIINYKLTDRLGIKNKKFNLADLETQMFRNNANLKTQIISNRIYENNIKSARSTLYPSLSLNAGIAQTNSFPMLNSVAPTYYSQNAYADLTLSYIIFNGNNRKRAVENAKIDTEKSELKTEELKMILRNNLHNLYEMYEIRKQMYKVAEENFKAASLNMEISKEKFRVGIINSFNIRDIQIIYMNTAFALSQSKYYMLTRYNDILKITGKILEAY